MSKQEKYYCDVCGEEVPDGLNFIGKKMQVIFTTEQDEGRSCKPYFSIEELDICNPCQERALRFGEYIYAKGAMGYLDKAIPRGHEDYEDIDIVGRIDTHDWWIHILADHRINKTPKDLPEFFSRVCSCKNDN